MTAVPIPEWYLTVMAILTMVIAFAVLWYFAMQVIAFVIAQTVRHWRLVEVFRELASRRRQDRAMEDLARKWGGQL